IKLQREVEDDDEESVVGPVIAPFFPHKKDEGWWIVIGDTSKNLLLGIKRITLNKSLNVKLDFTCPSEAGEHLLKIYFMSDSYMGCDQEFDLQIT
ncbi:28753_t:CDS:1, partial [Racocetra persica]